MATSDMPVELRHPFRMLLLHVPHGEAKPLCARMGIHPTTFSRWRSLAQRDLPSREMAARVCAYLGVSLDDIGTKEGLWQAELKVSLFSPTPTLESSAFQLYKVANLCLGYFSDVPPGPFMRERLSACLDDFSDHLEQPEL